MVIERAADGGYGAWSPDPPGCVALGDTPEDAIAETREAIQAHLSVPRELGQEIPRPDTVDATTVEAA